MKIVLDACSLIAFFEDEDDSEKVRDLLTHAAETENPALLSVVNWGEVYYFSLRAGGKSAALQVLKNIESLPIEIVPADQELTQIAAEFKAGHKMSYADTFAAALAKQKGARLVTKDREFKSVEDDIKIIWV